MVLRVKMRNLESSFTALTFSRSLNLFRLRGFGMTQQRSWASFIFREKEEDEPRSRALSKHGITVISKHGSPLPSRYKYLWSWDLQTYIYLWLQSLAGCSRAQNPLAIDVNLFSPFRWDKESEVSCVYGREPERKSKEKCLSFDSNEKEREMDRVSFYIPPLKMFKHFDLFSWVKCLREYTPDTSCVLSHRRQKNHPEKEASARTLVQGLIRNPILAQIWWELAHTPKRRRKETDALFLLSSSQNFLGLPLTIKKRKIYMKQGHQIEDRIVLAAGVQKKKDG